MAQPEMISGIAALLRGFNTGASQARAQKMEEAKLEQNQGNQEVQNAYYRALADKARREDMVSPELGGFLSNQLGMNTPSSAPSMGEAGLMVNAWKAKQDLASSIRMQKLEKKAEEQQNKAKQKNQKLLMENYKQLWNQKTKLQGQKTLMIDAGEVAKADAQIAEIDKELERLRLVAPDYDITYLPTPAIAEPFANTQTPTTMPTIPQPQGQSFLNRLTGF